MRSAVHGTGIFNSVLERGMKHRTVVQTLTGAMTIDIQSPQVLFLDPGGAGRNVTLPAVTKGLYFIIVNTADANENLTVKNAGATTIGVVPFGGADTFISDGTSWFALGYAASTDYLGFYGATPVVQPSGANQGAITDGSGGTVNLATGVAQATATYNSTIVNNANATVVAQLTAFRTALVALGLIKGSA